MLTAIKIVLAAGFLGYITLGLLLYLNQHSFLYYPTPELPSHDLDEINLNVDEATVKLYIVNPNQHSAIIYFGGNGESVIHNAPEFSHYFPNKTVYLVNYRGYAGSSGTPSEAALYNDAQVIFDYVAQHHQSIAVIGRSLGSGVATYLATQREIKKLALITPFDSIKEVAQKAYPLYPISLLLKDKYDSIGRAHNIKADNLILIAADDQVIPRQHAEKLAAAFNKNQVTVKVFENAGHNDISQHSHYYQTLQQFLIED